MTREEATRRSTMQNELKPNRSSSRGEYEELICDAAPPVNGWALTKKGYASAEYKAAEAEYLNGLAEWANGKQEDA